MARSERRAHAAQMSSWAPPYGVSACAPAAYWQRCVVALQAERANFLVLPEQEQHCPATFDLLIFTQAAVQLPVEVDPASFRP